MRKKILVVDDDTGLQQFFRMILERAGYEVQVFASPEKVLDQQYSLPDLFLLDKQISDFDGLEVCRFLKTQPSTSTIPVIMVSANPDIATLSIEAGADNYIEKPFAMKRLVQVVEQYTHRESKQHDTEVVCPNLRYMPWNIFPISPAAFE